MIRFSLVLIALASVTVCAYARVELSPCRNRFPPDAQIELGKQSTQQVYRQMPVLPDNSPVTQYIQQLGSKLADHAPGYKWPYNFHVADVAEINAFALPGGTIFVNLGTIQAAENEAQLAGVMAHEISHVVLQHSVCNEEKQQRVGLLAGLGEMAAGIALGGTTTGGIAEGGIQDITSLGFLKMSRSAEKQADLEGVGILYDASYDPRGMVQFFAIIEAKYGEGGAQFLNDHPNPGNRLEYVDKEVASFPPRDSYVTTSPDFEHIQQVVSGMHAYTAGEIASGAWKRHPANQKVKEGADNNGKTGKNAPDLSPPTQWKGFSVHNYTLEIPLNWRVYRRQSEAIAGPSGGVIRATDGGAGNATVGMMTGVYHPEKDLGDSAALDALVHEITQSNPNIKPDAQREIKIHGISAQTVECRNPSGSNGQSERYWITAFRQKNGLLRYFAFVAPTEDFKTLRPTFHRILRSITPDSSLQ